LKTDKQPWLRSYGNVYAPDRPRPEYRKISGDSQKVSLYKIACMRPCMYDPKRYLFIIQYREIYSGINCE